MILRSALILIPTLLAGANAKKAEPRIFSVHPLSIERGKPVEVVIRASNLDQPHALWFSGSGVQGRIARVEELADHAQLVHAELTASTTGTHKLGLMTASGLTNEIAIRIAPQPVPVEPAVVSEVPAILAGRLERSGEVDEYSLNAKAGDTFLFQVIAGADALDPAVGLYEHAASWFDPNRVNRIAWNDEPVWFPGYPKDAKLVYRFEHAGKYSIRVQGSPGQGSPDCVYELSVTRVNSEQTPLRPPHIADWEEREMTRTLTADWMERIASRGGPADKPSAPEIYRAIPEGSGEIPVMKLPGLVEGVLAVPGETHAIRINVEKAQELVIEVETPEATLPQFNPVIGLIEPGGTEIVGNVYTRLNNNNLKMMKSLKAKTAFALNAPGVYTLRIHELTTDIAGADFRYRVLVRPQIPHVGKFVVQQQRVNLVRGSTRPVSVRVEREEGYTGVVALQMENLPAGVTAMTGVENPPEIPALPNAGKPERYQPRVQTTSILLAAAPDAPQTDMPSTIKVVARTVSEGRLGDPIPAGEITLAVVGEK